MKTTPGYATFLGKNGYDSELERALKILEVGKEYKVVDGSIGRSSSWYRLEGFDGTWNSVFFDADWETLPVKESYWYFDDKGMKTPEIPDWVKKDVSALVDALSGE